MLDVQKKDNVALRLGDHNPQDRKGGRRVQQPVIRHWGRRYSDAGEEGLPLSGVSRKLDTCTHPRDVVGPLACQCARPRETW